ncbi:MAG: hypothetical protein ACRBG0_00425 [Lewinella sp.]|uniref:hypothetical protein n=1 Tax=Lewinella sp. TaxID=2004506 RepID=UPI003D6B3970
MRTYFWLTGFLSLGISLLVAGEPFFWDTIQLGARHADWFYNQPLSTLLLPDEMDSGHIPAFGYYLATCWRLFGQTLLVSHLAMFPFIWLVLWQGYRLVNKLDIGFRFATLALALGVLLLDATLVAQLSLVSPDIVLIGAFFLGINSILKKTPIWLGIAILLLGLTSLRGMMVAFGLFLWQLSLLYLDGSKKDHPLATFKLLLPYLPGGLVALAYLIYHYQIKGWVGTHPDSPWAASFASQGGLSIIKQAAIVAWRILDFGRIFVVIALMLSWWQTGWVWNKSIRRAAILLLIMGITLALPVLVSPGLSQHRYLLPVYLMVAYLFLLVIKEVQNKTWATAMVIVVLLGQVSGHFWVYPDQMAQGWDASLAHKPYFEAKKAGLAYLQQEKIPLSAVGTAFPEVGEQHLRMLNNMKEGLVSYDLDQLQYIWYTNIMNDLSDEELLTLQTSWTPVFTFRKRGVHLEIYHRK